MKKQDFNNKDLYIMQLEEENKKLRQEKQELINWLKEEIDIYKKKYISSTRYENVCDKVLEKIKKGCKL
jgi:hypothetical protein